MQPAKVIYFIQGSKPTDEEQAEINAILASQTYLAIRTDDKPAMYGITAEACDYVAGDVPATHTDKPVWSGAILSPTQALINSGDDVLVDFGSDVPSPGIGAASITNNVLIVEFDGTIGTVKENQPFSIPVSVNSAANALSIITPHVVNGSIVSLKIDTVE